MRNKGITLVALVITIILLLILAGVVINLALGENGLLKMASNTTKTYKIEEIREKVKLALLDYNSRKMTKEEEPEVEDALKNLLENGTFQEINKETSIGIIDDYEITLSKEKGEVVIGEIAKAGLRINVSNITITTDGTTEAKDKEVEQGTPLIINFTHSIEGGTTTVDKTLPYTTDGTETEVTFTITGVVNGENCTKELTIPFANKYREPSISDMVEIGDFVNYSVGNWTQADMEKLGTMYSGTSEPTAQGKFGMFNVGMSKDSSINTYGSYTNQFANGWRVLSKNADGTINIIHAGTCEAYYSSSNNAVAGANLLKNLRDWSMYEDCSTDSVNTSYAVAGSAHCLTKSEMNIIATNNSIRNIGVYYWTSDVEGSNAVCFYTSKGLVTGGGNGSFGIRPVVMLKSTVKVEAQAGQTTHTTPATAWNLILEETTGE